VNDKSGWAFSGEYSYQDPQFYRLWLEMEYYDDNFDIQTTGYNWRNDFISYRSGFALRRQDPWYFIRFARTGFRVEQEETTNHLLLNQVIDWDFGITFLNYWRLGGGLNRSFVHYSDKTTYDYQTGELGPIVKIPQTDGGYFYLRSDSRAAVSFSLSSGFGHSTLGDWGRQYNFSLVLKPTEYLDIGLSYQHGKSFEQFHWLEITEVYDNNEPIEKHFMFTKSHNSRDVITFRCSGNITRDISLQLYSEYFRSRNDFDETGYSELLEDKAYPVVTDYQPYSPEPDETQLLSPNLYVGFYSKYTSLNTNIVLRWEYLLGSTLYLVYSIQREINGQEFDHLVDFMRSDGSGMWTELYNSQSLFFKIDYWFDF